MAFQRRQFLVGNAATASSLLLFLFLLCFWFPSSAAAPSNFPKRDNLTIEVPAGSRYLPGAKLLCSPSTWKSIATFFFANYFAHAFTIKSQPGQTTIAGFVWAAFALFHPTSGVVSGIEAILQHTVFCRQPLEAVSKSRGLCVVVRTPLWKAHDGDVVEGVHRGWNNPDALETRESRKFDEDKMRWKEQLYEKRVQEEKLQEERAQEDPVEDDRTAQISVSRSPSPSTRNVGPTLGIKTFLQGNVALFSPANNMWSLRNRKVHGICCLPSGYALVTLPEGTCVDPLPKLESNHSRNTGKDPEWKFEIQDSIILPGFLHKLGFLQKLALSAGWLVNKHYSKIWNPRGHFSDEISTSYSFPKCLAAILQTIFATFTLFETRGDQIHRYGYAAFGLTVTPYLIMSLVNLLGIALTPDYPTMYLVETDVLKEASKRPGGRFEGMVARIAETYDEDAIELSFKVDSDGRTALHVSSDPHGAEAGWSNVDHYESMYPTEMGGMPASPPTYIIPSTPTIDKRVLDRRLQARMKIVVYSVLVDVLVIAIIGVLSHFKQGSSGVTQRAWTMSWLSFGMIYGLCSAMGNLDWERDGNSLQSYWAIQLPLIFLFGIPAFGGFVAVGQMLKSYGSCRELY